MADCSASVPTRSKHPGIDGRIIREAGEKTGWGPSFLRIPPAMTRRVGQGRFSLGIEVEEPKYVAAKRTRGMEKMEVGIVSTGLR
jgi:hypothetical protein